jgi:hypothetical protein
MATGKKLDRTRPFGTVHGNDTGKEAFSQDGAYFDANGDEVPGVRYADPPKKGEKGTGPASEVDKQLG